MVLYLVKGWLEVGRTTARFFFCDTQAPFLVGGLTLRFSDARCQASAFTFIIMPNLSFSLAK